MAVTTAVLSGKITDLTSALEAKYLKRIVAVIESNTDGSMLLDTDGNRILAGPKRVTVDSSTGAYSVTLPKTNSADIIPVASRLYRVRLIYPSGIPGAGNIFQLSGWWELTADGSLSDADKWAGLEVTAVTDELLDSLAEMVAAAEAAQVGAEAAQAAVEAVVATTDGLMTVVDANAASTFRVQQDARLLASIAAHAVPRAGGTSTNQAPRRALDPRDYGVKADLRTFPDGVMVSGSNQLSCAHYTFSAVDIGKKIKVVGAGAAGANLKTTITGYTSGKAVLAVTASTSVTGVYSPLPAITAAGNFIFGTDDTTAIQALWNAAVTYSTGSSDTLVEATRRVEHPRGVSLFFGTLTVPRRSTIRGIGCWGAYGLYDGYGYEQINGTTFYQGWDSNADAIIFTESATGVNYVISDIADFTVQQDLDNTSGKGIAYRNGAGTALQWSDGNRAENVEVIGFAEHCWYLPGGMVPGHMVNCRALFAGKSGGAAGTAAGLYMTMAGNGSISDIDNFSADGCSDGAIWLKGAGGFNTIGVVKIRSLKYEVITNPYRTTAPRGEYAVTLDSMGGAVVDVDGGDCIAAGSETAAPSGFMQVTAAAQTPVVTGRACRVRVLAGQTGTPVLLRDFNWDSTKPIANDTIEFTHTAGGVSRGTKVWMSTAANLRWVIGYPEWFGADSSAANPGMQMVGAHPIYALANYSAPTDLHRAHFAVDVDGRVALRAVKDDGTTRDVVSMKPGATRAADRVAFDIPVGLIDRQAIQGARMTIGEYHTFPLGAANVGSNVAPFLNAVYWLPVPIARDCTLDKLGIYVTTVAAAGGTLRFGLRADDGNGKPGTLVADFGTVDSSSTGGASGTTRGITGLGLALTRGLYHFGICAQGNVTGLTIPASSRSNALISTAYLSAAVQAQARSYLEGGVTGTFATNPTLVDPGLGSPTGGNRDFIFALQASA